MPLYVREADLDADRSLILGFLRGNLNGSYSSARYEWLYLKNPAGCARVWIAWGKNPDVPVGLSAAIPRILTIQGQNRLCWILADFCFATSYRSLGPALKLQRTTLDEAARDKVYACLDFPGKSMVPVYSRLGIPVFTRMDRFARILKLNHKMDQFIPIPFVSRMMSAIGNRSLQMIDQRILSSSGITVIAFNGEFDEQFAILAQKATASYDCFSHRSVEYLNWRYVRNPIQSHKILACYMEEELVGYAVISRGANGDIVLQEIMSLPIEGLWTRIVKVVSGFLRKTGAYVVYYGQSSQGSKVPFIGSAGYYLRDSAPVFVRPFVSQEDLPVAEAWLLMNGDRDS